ncbi:hypothetical protein RPATATE_1586 [Rickettsia parkeri str. Tate's Hell]|uniref:Uncharacterized protein n=1 Tax=Rickettsia parkeri str. Tate's Hell TaxID=1359189 RepID=A0ABR5DNF4_RICPA|nr:hypothetical protein RPAAT24_0937 [Rickettsia parkeri str. AT\
MILKKILVASNLSMRLIIKTTITLKIIASFTQKLALSLP